MAGPVQRHRPYLKKTKAKKAWGVAQMVACLPRKLEALSSILITTHTHTHTNPRKQHKQNPT
jgi:hypothetical protein